MNIRDRDLGSWRKVDGVVWSWERISYEIGQYALYTCVKLSKSNFDSNKIDL